MEELKELANVRFVNDWWVLLLPFSLMAIDFLTGFVGAWLTGHIKSFKMREGLAKKAGEIALLIAAELITMGLLIPTYVRTGISMYIILMEIVSLFENLDKLHVPIPNIVKRALGVAEDVVNGEELSEEAKGNIKKMINDKRKEE